MGPSRALVAASGQGSAKAITASPSGAIGKPWPPALITTDLLAVRPAVHRAPDGRYVAASPTGSPLTPGGRLPLWRNQMLRA